jgi:hypothetical protein
MSRRVTAWRTGAADGYQKRFDQLKDKGFYPVQVNAENGKYAAIFQ